MTEVQQVRLNKKLPSLMIVAIGNAFLPGVQEGLEQAAIAYGKAGGQCKFTVQPNLTVMPPLGLGAMRNFQVMKAVQEGFDYLAIVDNDVLVDDPETFIKLVGRARQYLTPWFDQSPIGRNVLIADPMYNKGQGVLKMAWTVPYLNLFQVSMFRQIGVYRPFTESMIYCLPSGERLQTEDGLRPVESLTGNVLSKNGAWEAQRRIPPVWYDGTVSRLRVQGTPRYASMTPNHRILIQRRQTCQRFPSWQGHWCRPRCNRRDSQCPILLSSKDHQWVKANDIQRGDLAVIPKYPRGRIEGMYARWETQFKQSRHIHATVDIMQDSEFWRLIGYWFGDGYEGKGLFHFTFGTKDAIYVEDVKNIAKRLFHRKSSIYFKRNVRHVFWHSKQLALWLQHHFRQGKSKVLPPWFLGLPEECQREFVKGLWRADGYFHPATKEYVIASISLDALETIQQALWQVGINSSIVQSRKGGVSYIGTNKVNSNTLWQLKGGNAFGAFLGEQPTIAVNRSQMTDIGSHLLIPIADIATVRYKGWVWNFETADSHSYVGHGLTLHNCEDEFNSRFFQCHGVDIWQDTDTAVKLLRPPRMLHEMMGDKVRILKPFEKP